MLRKAKVNDIVRSFVYAVRKHEQTGNTWPFPILGFSWENAMRPLPAWAMLPFTAWAYAQTRNYVIANRHLVLMANYLRDLTLEEQEYAVSLMQRYYLPGANLNVSL